MTEKKKKEYYALYPKPEDEIRMEAIKKETSVTEAGILRWGMKLLHEKLFGKE